MCKILKSSQRGSERSTNQSPLLAPDQTQPPSPDSTQTQSLTQRHVNKGRFKLTIKTLFWMFINRDLLVQTVCTCVQPKWISYALIENENYATNRENYNH